MYLTDTFSSNEDNERHDDTFRLLLVKLCALSLRLVLKKAAKAQRQTAYLCPNPRTEKLTYVGFFYIFHFVCFVFCQISKNWFTQVLCLAGSARKSSDGKLWGQKDKQKPFCSLAVSPPLGSQTNCVLSFSLISVGGVGRSIEFLVPPPSDRPTHQPTAPIYLPNKWYWCSTSSAMNCRQFSRPASETEQAAYLWRVLSLEIWAKICYRSSLHPHSQRNEFNWLKDVFSHLNGCSDQWQWAFLYNC